MDRSGNNIHLVHIKQKKRPSELFRRGVFAAQDTQPFASVLFKDEKMMGIKA